MRTAQPRATPLRPRGRATVRLGWQRPAHHLGDPGEDLAAVERVGDEGGLRPVVPAGLPRQSPEGPMPARGDCDDSRVKISLHTSQTRA